MKIFYAIQATGNGHISRAMELLPYLQKYGEVDLFLSGSNSTLALSAPIKYRSSGLSLFYTCKGHLDYAAMVKKLAPYRMWKEARELPVEKYDLVINDFECITSLACSKKHVPSINFGHQASFYSSHTPRPANRSSMGEWILHHYAKSSHKLGLHFQAYDDFIMSPVIKSEILKAQPEDHGYVAVYLPAYCEKEMMEHFSQIPDFKFRIYSRQTQTPWWHRNIQFVPVEKSLFNEGLINCHALITGGGFETPAEALYLGKKLLTIPIGSQYEQQCNAAALEQLGVCKLDRLSDQFKSQFYSWMNDAKPVQVKYEHSTEMIVERLFSIQQESRSAA